MAYSIVRLVLEALNLWKRWHLAHDDYPVINYAEISRANSEAWRWSIPNAELNLRLEDEPNVSRIYLPHRLTAIEITMILFGYAHFGFGVVFAIKISLEKWNFLGMITIFALFGILGWMFLLVGSRIIRLELTPTDLTIVTKVGCLFETKYRYRCLPTLKVRGAYQHMLTMTRDQMMPDYNLWLKKGRFGGEHKYATACNQTQGTWLVAGIEIWRDRSQTDIDNS
ncbi:hypothetical protein BCD64_27915 [Nostoc sp. MBR 210]|nr:hypothetical protein BCD64_27915 [Nostoc sp. MBR 210]